MRHWRRYVFAAVLWQWLGIVANVTGATVDRWAVGVRISPTSEGTWAWAVYHPHEPVLLERGSAQSERGARISVWRYMLTPRD